MEIIKMDINDVIPYEKNAKIHTPEQIEQIKNSILEFGNNDPIAIDKNNVIIEGHGRYMALKELGYEEVEVIKLGHLTEEQRKAYTLIHNKLTMNTGFDLEVLTEELKNIENIDMGYYDFDVQMEEFQLEEVDEDNWEFEETESEPTAKRGQIYQLGNHRLMCGDSTNMDDVKKLMDGNQADLLLTDPPYNVAVQNSQGMTIENDNLKEDEFRQFLTSAFKCAEASLKPGGAFYIWFASKEHIAFETSLNNANLFIRQELIWNKHHFILGRQDYQWKHEPCLYGWKDGAPHYFTNSRSETTVLSDEAELDFKKMKKRRAGQTS